MPTFVTPSVRRPLDPSDIFFRRVKYDVGLTVLKRTDGSYVTVENPSPDDIDNSAKAYLGGREYVITDDEAASLTAAGYEVRP